MNMPGIIAVIAAVLLLAGCNTEGCLNNQSALPLAGFYSSLTGKEVTVTDLTIRGKGAPGDSILVHPTDRISEVYLPMRSDYDSTVWDLEFLTVDKVTVTDQILFAYTSKPYFASEECGAMYFYHIDRVDWTTNVIDSVVVTDSLITNVDMKRIKIYLHEEEQAPGEGSEQ